MTNIRPGLRIAVLVVVCICSLRVVHAQDTLPRAPRRDSTRVRALEPVKVTGRIEDLIGTAATASEGRVGAVDLLARPITREGELLESVPGMIVTQHSGEGKANQFFVRGFNLDHGTDFQTRIEGMPLNMPTHGHGQGWTDLNFLTPELVDRIDYRLGVYHAQLGDFGSAGGAEFLLVRSLARPFVTLAGGANGLTRIATGASRRVGAGDMLVAGEFKTYDSAFELAERIRKFSGVARYSWDRGSSRFSVLGMAYRNRWNSNDQVPLRAVENGLISRFDQIDSTDGGNAERYSLSGSWRRVSGRSMQEVQLFGIYSNLNLFSNFTYFLDDPVRGDQFTQPDRRGIVGGNATNTRQLHAFGVVHLAKAGLQTRADIINGLGLYRTQQRVRVTTVREDRVRETGSGLFLESESRWLPRFRTVLGVRGDVYTFDVRSDRTENSGRRAAAILSPKASLVFTPAPSAELYLSGGFGFHSNDARGTTITVDPVSGDSAVRVDPLVRSRGAEVGVRATPVAGLRSTLSLWALDLDSELLFTGDAGGTEPSAASRRRGVTFANFYRPLPTFSIDADVSFATAAFRGLPIGATRIPGALETVFAGGAAWTPPRSGTFGGVRVRHFGAYPLNEANSQRARASTLLSGDIGYQLLSGTRLQATVLNLLNARADDIRYSYKSRLRGEPAGGVDDTHFHPVEPRQIRASLEWRF